MTDVELTTAFAGQAMAAIVSRADQANRPEPAAVAVEAFSIADAMVTESRARHS